MKLILLTPGTGNFHCGNCLRDNSLALALKKLGHEALMVPLYLPMVADAPHDKTAPIFFGGLNVYLQHKSALFRKTPAWLDRLFNATPLLRAAASQGTLGTRAAGLMLGAAWSRASSDVPRAVAEMLRGDPIEVAMALHALPVMTLNRLDQAMAHPFELLGDADPLVEVENVFGLSADELVEDWALRKGRDPLGVSRFLFERGLRCDCEVLAETEKAPDPT